ncbi:MAG: 3-keto-5-aminohexanoate cleavage protein [Chloroflexi bacterium RBG_13_52_14]|nr:MAG: 3-keto-5-aminohexanoate cleavage protein [Chloroflexi bacterium RBG_13_52_14]
MEKVIITAALTGAAHTPSMSPYLPITPDELAEEAVKSYKAGAAVAHIHVRDPETGKPNNKIELFREVAVKVKNQCNMVLSFTTGGGFGPSDEERLRVVQELKPELCTFNIGSMNFGIFPMGQKHDEYKFAWEKPYLDMTYDYIFPNTFKSLVKFVETMNQNGTKPEMEIYDVGMVSSARWLIKQGLIKPPVYIQFVMGIFGGIPATVENLVFLYKTAHESIGDFVFSVAAAGKNQLQMAATSLALKGNVRVGLEDSLFTGKGQLAKSNAEQVEKAVQLVNALGLEVATPADVREILGLKGLDKVNY